MKEILFRGKDKDDGNWYEGYYLQLNDTTYCCLPSDNAEGANRLNKENEHHYIVFERMTDWGLPNKHLRAEVLPETVCRYVGKTDKDGRKIFEGDIVKLLLPDGETRCFKVSVKSVVRKVLNHPDFDAGVSRVEITGVVFEWNGYELFPCVDTYGIPDYKMMEVIGNIFDNPELLEGAP